MPCDNCGHFGYVHGAISGLCRMDDCACPGFSTKEQEQTGLEYTGPVEFEKEGENCAADLPRSAARGAHKDSEAGE